MITKLSKKRMDGIERLLDGEEIIDAVSGAVDGKVLGGGNGKQNGVLVLTPKRVLFYWKRMLGGYKSEDFPLEKISSINSGKGMMTWNIKIHTSGNNVDMDWIPKEEDADAFVKAVKEQMEKTKTPNIAPVLDVADQILKLAALKDQGILTEEEFGAKKKQLLGIQ